MRPGQHASDSVCPTAGGLRHVSNYSSSVAHTVPLRKWSPWYAVHRWHRHGQTVPPTVRRTRGIMGIVSADTAAPVALQACSLSWHWWWWVLHWCVYSTLYDEGGRLAACLRHRRWSRPARVQIAPWSTSWTAPAMSRRHLNTQHPTLAALLSGSQHLTAHHSLQWTQ